MNPTYTPEIKGKVKPPTKKKSTTMLSFMFSSPWITKSLRAGILARHSHMPPTRCPRVHPISLADTILGPLPQPNQHRTGRAFVARGVRGEPSVQTLQALISTSMHWLA